MSKYRLSRRAYTARGRRRRDKGNSTAKIDVNSAALVNDNLTAAAGNRIHRSSWWRVVRISNDGGRATPGTKGGWFYTFNC